MQRVRVALSGVRLPMSWTALAVFYVLASTACLRRDAEPIRCRSDAECSSSGKICDLTQNICVPSVGFPGAGGSTPNGQGGGESTTGGTIGEGQTGGQSSNGSGGSASSSGGAPAAGGSLAQGGSGTQGGSDAGGSGGSMQGGNSTGGAPDTSSSDLIDDLEDNDGRITTAAGRTGPWHIFNSQEGGGNQQPPSSSPFLPESSGANGTQRAVHTSGDGYTYAGVGFDLNNADTVAESAMSQPYDVSEWDGIAFWAKGTGKLRIEVPTRNFVPSDRGGNCTSDCWNVYGYRLPSGLTSDWQEYRVPFSAMEREMGGRDPAFSAPEAMSISFKHEGDNDRFDFWIDEIRFYKGAPSGGTP